LLPLKVNFICRLSIISVDFNLTDRSLIKFLYSSYTREKLGVQLHEVFIDFKKAYDSVRREVLYKILTEFGIPIKSIRVIKMCLNKINSKACIFPIRNDLKHGDAELP
jgi:hypothetical protein